MGTYIFSGERELGGENLQALNSLHNKKAELLKKASAQADATSVDKGGIFDGGSIDEQYSKKLAEYKDAYAQQTGFLGKATDLARNGLNAIGIGKGGKSKTKKEQAELEAAYAQLEAARKSGKGIEQAEELVKKELADSEKQIERRKDGNSAWVEGIATMASITAGFVVTALTKGKVSAGMATASTVKTFLKGGDELTSKDGEGYTLKEGIRDAATGAVDFGFAHVGNKVGGLVRGRIGKAAGLAAGRLAEGVFDAGSGAGVETVTQLVDGKGLNASKIAGAGIGAGIAGVTLGSFFDISGVGMKKAFGKAAKGVADNTKIMNIFDNTATKPHEFNPLEKKIMAKLRPGAVEDARVIDVNGLLVEDLKFIGDKYGVRIDIEKMAENIDSFKAITRLKNSTYIHNHPPEALLSTTDIYFMLMNNINKMVSTAPSGGYSYLKKLPGEQKSTGKTVNNLMKNELKFIKSLANNKKITDIERLNMLNEWRVKNIQKFADEYGYEFVYKLGELDKNQDLSFVFDPFRPKSKKKVLPTAALPDGGEVAGVKTEANSFITTRIPADEVKPKKFIVIDSNDDVVTYLDISNGQKLTHAEMAKRLAKAKGGNNVEVEALYLASETTGSKQGRGFDVNLKELDGIFDNILKRKNAGENIAAVNMSFGDEISISRLAELTDLPLTSQNLKEYAETARAEILKRSEIAKEGRRLYNEVYMPARTKVDEYKAQYATSPQGLPKEIENEIAHLNNIVRETSAKLRAMGDDSVIDKYQECDRLARRILQVEKLTSNGIVVYNSAGNGGAGRINTISLAKGVKSIGTCDNTGKAFGYSANNGLVSFRNQPEIMYSFDANGKIDGYVLKGEEVPFMKVDEIEGFKPWQNDYLGELPDKHLLSEADIAVLINDPKLRYNKQYSHKLVPTKDYRKIFPPTNSIQEQSVQNIEKMNGLVTVNGIYHFIPDENGRLRFAKNEPCATPVGTSFTSPLAMVEDFIEQSGGTMPTNALHNGVEVAGVKTEANPFAKAPDNKFKAFSAAVHAEGKAKYDEAFNEIRNALPEDLRNSLVGRTKGVTSINDRLIREAGKGKTIETVADAIVAIPDLVGTRLILDDASPAMIDKIVDSLVDAIKKGDLKVTEIENYRGANGKPYFTEVHLDKLKKADPEIMVLEGQKATKKSGYTTTQMNIKAKNGANVEFQVRGKQINELAEVEHLAHDLRMGKDLSKGIKELAELYKPLETVVKSMDESQNTAYTNYLAAMYNYIRSREMGMPAKNPTLSEGLDKILSIESLKDLHHRAQEIVSAQKLAA